MLIICDFDGTVTETDTLNHLCRRFAPQVFDRLEGKLSEGKLTLRQVLSEEVEAMRAPAAEIVAAAVAEVRLREGFDRFVAALDRNGHRLVILSAGFRQLIEPMLAHAGITGLHIIAHDAYFGPEGGSVTFRSVADCAECGQPCKRSEVDELSQGEPVIYVGDGYSDRCAASYADRVFARAGLADYLRHRGVSFAEFSTFDDITEALQLT